LIKEKKFFGIYTEINYKKFPNTKEGKDRAVDIALRKFKKKVKDFGLMPEIQNSLFYKKPSTKKREKRLKSLLRNRFNNGENNWKNLS